MTHKLIVTIGSPEATWQEARVMISPDTTVTDSTRGAPDRCTPTATTPGRPSRRGEPRLDTVVTTLIERQVEAVLAGIAVAALHSGPGIDPDGRDWLARELAVAVRLTRVATAAGVVLPAALPTFTPDEREASRHAHLIRSRSRYQAIEDVFSRLVAEEAIPGEVLQDARRLLAEVGDLLQRIERDAPDQLPEPALRATGRAAHEQRRYLPGELLG